MRSRDLMFVAILSSTVLNAAFAQPVVDTAARNPTRARVLELRPSAGSDVLVPEAWMTTNDSHRWKFSLSGEHPIL